jgi:hypothetical protein
MNNLFNPQDIEDAYPLSMLQQGMIFHSLQHSSLSMYHDIFTYRIHSSWSPGLFKKALEILVDKHATLRTVFYLEGSRPLQLVMVEKEIECKEFDLLDVEASLTDGIIQEWVEGEKARDIELLVAPWRASVHVLSSNEIIFGLSFHHVLLDGWSVASFVTELFSTYSLLKSGGSVDSSVRPPSYKHFVALEQSELESSQAQSYWDDQLAEVNLPWWSGEKRDSGEKIYYELSKDSSRQLMELAAKLGVQEKSVWCAVYYALMSLLDGTDDVVASVVIHGRPEMQDAEKTLGLFLNSLPMRLDVRGSWIDLIRKVEEGFSGLHSVRHFPLAEIQQRSGLDFSASLFNYVNFHVYEDIATDTRIVDGGGFEETNYRLVVSVSKNEKLQKFGVHINVDSAVFDSEFRDRIHGYVGNIIDQLLSSAGEVIAKGALLGEAERDQQLTWSSFSLQPS